MPGTVKGFAYVTENRPNFFASTVSNLGSNNELHEADMKASYYCAVMLI